MCERTRIGAGVNEVVVGTKDGREVLSGDQSEATGGTEVSGGAGSKNSC